MRLISAGFIGVVIGFSVTGYAESLAPSIEAQPAPHAVVPLSDDDLDTRGKAAEQALQHLVKEKSVAILDGRPYSGRIKQRMITNGLESIVTMTFSGDFSKMDMIGPEGRQVIIVNDQGYFVYTPEERQAIQMMAADEPEALRRFGRLNAVGTLAAMDSLDVHQFQFLRAEEFQGKRCDVYTVEGPEASTGRLTYWVAEGFRYPLKVEQEGRNGKRVIEFLEFEPNVHVSMEEFKIPGRVTVLNLAGEEIVKP